nr:transposase [Streptomyces sp. NRRL F-2664]
MFLPAAWDGPDAEARRRACRIPDTVHHRAKWQLALDMLDKLASNGLRPAVLVADTGYGANADFRRSLADHGRAYVCRSKPQ